MPVSDSALGCLNERISRSKDEYSRSLRSYIRRTTTLNNSDHIHAGGTQERSDLIDVWVREFIEKNPKCKIINLGCGFCTRFFKLDNGQIKWLEVDKETNINARKGYDGQFFKGHMRGRYSYEIADLNEKTKWGADLIIAEGVLMYLFSEKSEEIISNKGRIIADVFLEGEYKIPVARYQTKVELNNVFRSQVLSKSRGHHLFEFNS